MDELNYGYRARRALSNDMIHGLNGQVDVDLLIDYVMYVYDGLWNVRMDIKGIQSWDIWVNY